MKDRVVWYGGVINSNSTDRVVNIVSFVV